MRLNRGTIALIVVALVVIIGVAVLNNNQATAPGANTPTPETPSGPLWQGLDQNTVTRLEVRDNHTGQAIALGKAQNGGWDVVDSAAAEPVLTGSASSVRYVKPQSLPIDTSKVSSSVTAFAGLRYADKFDSETPVDFGMDKPLYTIYATTNTGAVYAIHVGNKNPNNTRYYVTIQQIVGASTTPEATSAAVATSEATSAVEGAIAAVSSAMDAQSAAVSALEATATAEATSAATSEATAMTVAATAEATAEGTAAATPETTAAAPVGASASTPEATPVILAEPLVTLTGKQTIYLVPQDVISSMVGFLAVSPYVYPTATPTMPPTANPYSEVQQTATAMIQQTAMMSTMQSMISTATARAMTPEATAAATSAAPAEATTAAIAEATP